MIAFLDSSVLIKAHRRGGIFERIRALLGGEVRFATTKKVVKELRRLSLVKGPKGAAARTALLISQKIEVFPGEGPPDLSLLKAAQRYRESVVVTSDVELSKKCLERRIPVVFVGVGGPRILRR